MRISADLLYELDRLRQRNFKWKILFIAMIAVIIIFSITRGNDPYKSDHIARIKIDDIIVDNSEVVSAIDEIAEDKSSSAIIVLINSSGGSPYMSEEIYHSLRRVSQSSKPVAVVIRSLAASGGFMVAMAGDRIFAGETSITGSIGAIMQTIDASVLAEKIGIKIKNYAYPEMKGVPSPTEKVPPFAEKILNEVAMDVYDSFINIVSTRRNIAKQELLKFADGRIYTGKQALELKLIDQIGGEHDALQWLYNEKNISKNAKIKDVHLEEKSFGINRFVSQLSRNFSTKISQIVTDNLISRLKFN